MMAMCSVDHMMVPSVFGEPVQLTQQVDSVSCTVHPARTSNGFAVTIEG